jgi:hypothetical protein
VICQNLAAYGLVFVAYKFRRGAVCEAEASLDAALAIIERG